MAWLANHARARGAAWWKASSTGKPASTHGGIPHDTYGMTSLSVRGYTTGIYRKLGLREEDIKKVQTGGPDGDLGSSASACSPSPHARRGEHAVSVERAVVDRQLTPIHLAQTRSSSPRTRRRRVRLSSSRSPFPVSSRAQPDELLPPRAQSSTARARRTTRTASTATSSSASPRRASWSATLTAPSSRPRATSSSSTTATSRSRVSRASRCSRRRRSSRPCSRPPR